jgi:hypothetical protein
MINFKQMELAEMMFNTIKERYPEVELVDVMESGIYPDHVWVRVIMPTDEERESEIRHLAAEMSADIGVDYGYHMNVHATSPLPQSLVH